MADDTTHLVRLETHDKYKAVFNLAVVSFMMEVEKGGRACTEIAFPGSTEVWTVRGSIEDVLQAPKVTLP